MRTLALTIGLLATMASATPQTSVRRTIDQCSQDGISFEAIDDDPRKTISVAHDGVELHIERPDTESLDAVLTFIRGGHTLVQRQKDFETSYGWLTVSSSGAFAMTWKVNANSADSQLFELKANGDIVEDTELIPRAEHIFSADAKRHCKMPGVNTTAIKWIDKDHLLLAVNAWASGFCYSNFTEGFILDVASNSIQRKLTEQQLINLPAVCTWNLVPVGKR